MSDYQKYKYEDHIPLTIKLKRLAWNVVYLLLFRLTPSWMLNDWRIFLLKVFGAKIGQGCIVYPSCKVWAPWNLEMGDFSVMAGGVDCYCMDKIKIGSKVAISQRAFLCTGGHNIRSLKRPLITAPIIIGNHVWVCAEVYVGPGVELGEGSIVAARGVAVKNVEEWFVVAGNPAVKIKKRILE